MSVAMSQFSTMNRGSVKATLAKRCPTPAKEGAPIMATSASPFLAKESTDNRNSLPSSIRNSVLTAESTATERRMHVPRANCTRMAKACPAFIATSS